MKEIAKFFCGWESCHGALHTYFWLTGMEFTAFGIRFTPGVNALAAACDIVIAVALGVYAWRRPAKA
ncbi:MAG: hypothetical protein E6Q67_01960 [Roseateles sp.]|nr:MAG: hypothetical protein E6Q67_01960 [Roseateles sp.]